MDCVDAYCAERDELRTELEKAREDAVYWRERTNAADEGCDDALKRRDAANPLLREAMVELDPYFYHDLRASIAKHLEPRT